MNRTVTHDRTIFRWDDLPGEIKNLIYEHALCHKPDPVLIGLTSRGLYHKTTTCHGKSRTLVPNILLVNKQIYAEGIPILYGDNVLQFKYTYIFSVFCRHLRAPTLELVESIIISNYNSISCFYVHEIKSAFRKLATDATNLRSLVLTDHPDSYIGTTKDSVQQFYDVAKDWVMSLGRNKDERQMAVARLLKFGPNAAISTSQRWNNEEFMRLLMKRIAKEDIRGFCTEKTGFFNDWMYRVEGFVNFDF